MRETNFTHTEKELIEINNSFNMSASATNRYRKVKVTYMDEKTKLFKPVVWDIFREGIKCNLFDKGLVKIKPVVKYRIQLIEWLKRLLKWIK